MAAELMLINPRRKRRHHRRRASVIRARRNPRRKRRHMSALQAEYFGKGRRRSRRGRRRVIRATSNPRPRRRHRRRHYTIMRRNPSSVSNPVGFVSSELMPAALGAIGAVGMNYIFDNYAPASLQTGYLQPISQIGLAALLGLGVGAVTNNRVGASVATGAMIVTLYELWQNYQSTGSFVNTATSGQGQYGQGGGQYGQGGQMGRLMGNRMGRFVHGNNMGRIMGRVKGVGYFNPSRQLSC